MTKRQKQKIFILFVAIGISLFSYSREYLLEAFPELKDNPLFHQEKEKVRGDTTLALVTRVVDGDTMVVSQGEKQERVRLIGINTPETVDPRKPVECFGKEAKDYLKVLVVGKKVRLETDTSQQEQDRYGRLLRYVFLEDTTFVNQKLIEAGYAYEYTYELPYQYQEAFKKSESNARAASRGLWNTATCGGGR